MAAEIPDVNSARDRLGNLLKSIRNSTTLTNGKREIRDDDDEFDVSDEGDQSDMDDSMESPRRGGKVGLRRRSATKSPYGTPSDAKKRRRSQKKIIFELRQKAFEIQNSNMEHGLYALCRIWMRGKYTTGSVVTGQAIDRSNVDVDQESWMAVKSVSKKKPSTVQIETERDDPTEVTGDEQSASEILDQYLPRWRNAKREWCQQRQRTDMEKFGDSLRVLKEMFAQAQASAMGL